MCSSMTRCVPGRRNKVFTGNLPGVGGGERERRLESQGKHLLRSRKNVVVANQQIEINVTAHRRTPKKK